MLIEISFGLFIRRDCNSNFFIFSYINLHSEKMNVVVLY